MIPVLGVPVLNRPDHLRTMIESIDELVDKLVIVDNSEGGLGIGPQENQIRIHHNLGVSASWNLVLKATPLADWWAFVGSDVILAPGDLRRLVDHMDARNEEPAFAMLVTPDAFAINHLAVERVGLWDENFVPGYFEDNDMAWRLHLADIQIGILHGGYAHAGSATIKSDPHLYEENSRTFPLNQAYYQAKWGGNPTYERFTTPFNEGGPISAWSLDFGRLRAQTWR